MNATKQWRFSDAMPRDLTSTANAERYLKGINTKTRYKIFETEADFQKSTELGRLLTLEELPEFLSSGGLQAIENIAHYKQNGSVKFWLNTKDTDMGGFYRFDQEGHTLQEMFTKVDGKEFGALPFEERAYFWKGNQPLFVTIWGQSSGAYLYVDGNCRLDYGAPVVVVAAENNELASYARR